MPDISKINALDIGSVSKVDGLAKASISTIDGITVPSAALLLDTYTGAAAGYSVRRLNSLYTGACMRVRRLSDGVEGDVGFDSNNLIGTTSPISNTSDLNSYTDFADFITPSGTATDGYVHVWYDQSQSGGTGSGNDASGTATGLQPKIYDSSTGFIEEGSVGYEKPAIAFLPTASNFNVLASTGFGTGSTRYFSAVARLTQTTSPSNYHNVLMFMQNATTSTTGNFLQLQVVNATNDNKVNFPTNTLDISSTTAVDVQTLFSVQKTSTDAEYWLDSISQGTATGTQALEDELSIGRFSTFGWAHMHLQELVVWNTDQDGLGNRTGIETNIDGYFNI